MANVSREDNLAEVLQQAVCEAGKWRCMLEEHLKWTRSHGSKCATKTDLEESLGKLMSVLSDYIERATAHHTTVLTGIGVINTSITDIAGDVTSLGDQITELKKLIEAGAETPELIAALNKLETQQGEVVTALSDVGTKAAQIAALNPPPAPGQPS